MMVTDLYWMVVTRGFFKGYNPDGTPLFTPYIPDTLFTQNFGGTPGVPTDPGQPICVQVSSSLLAG